MKRPRYLADWLLLGVIALGVVFVVRLSQEQAILKAEYERLAQISGELKITDPSKVHLRAIKTDDPLHFAWHVYLPRNYALSLKDSGGGSSWSKVSEPTEFVARVRLREGERGAFQVYSSFYGGSSLMSVGDKSVVDFLRGRENELEITQLGAKATIAIPANEAATIISIRLSDKLIAEAKEQERLAPAVLERYTPAIYELKLQPPGTNP